jgi:hypothetical protein
VATEAFVDADYVQARAMKEATRDLHSYEHVFYTSKARPHVKGKNTYEFEFPGSWRTKSGHECILGIRALYLKKTTRILSFMTIFVFEDSEGHDYPHYMPWYFEFTPNRDVGDMLSYLNERIYDNVDLRDLFVWCYHPDVDEFVIEGVGQTSDLPENWRLSSFSKPGMDKDRKSVV